jgi:hypothetical protein
MRLIHFSKTQFGQTRYGNYYSELHWVFSKRELFERSGETGIAMVNRRRHQDREGKPFEKEDVVRLGGNELIEEVRFGQVLQYEISREISEDEVRQFFGLL